MKALFVVVCVLLAVGSSLSASYEGFKVIRITIDNENQVNRIKSIINANENCSFWSDKYTIPGEIDVQVSPKAVELLFNEIESNNMKYDIVHDDLQADINHLFQLNEKIQNQADSDFFDSYADFDQMEAFLTSLQAAYPTMSSLVTVGKTLENRDITGIVITGTENTNMTKPKIVINGCQHAREWISPMTVAFIAQSLLQNYTSYALVEQLVNDFEWTIIPIVNGDGYVYTWTDDRLWRKNRRKNEGSACYGVDLNRNWDFEWGTDGSLQIPCADTYAGPSPFSEPEETALANYISAQENVVAYIDYHAYGELFMYPWGYVCDDPTPDATTQNTGAILYAQAAQSVHGVTYTTGPICDTIYPASGDSADWTYGAANVVYSYACELRGDSFILPPEEIIPSGQETFAGIISWAKYIDSQV